MPDDTKLHFAKHQLWHVRPEREGGDRLLSAVENPANVDKERKYWRTMLPGAKLEYRDRDKNGKS